jgi:hypothetical protein
MMSGQAQQFAAAREREPLSEFRAVPYVDTP